MNPSLPADLIVLERGWLSANIVRLRKLSTRGWIEEPPAVFLKIQTK